ncbi:hypothetical protein CTheo_4230 [Ceratobasidium theobromae]|uniref:Secreted protein n=1 Tax=Ceratobasidium theobromae TaxID=1582974 RepID=A0A5N5QL16_9AGAM|nr:hypothetical protein CTheo_4230 [Ceratobasidium theobromae]
MLCAPQVAVWAIVALKFICVEAPRPSSLVPSVSPLVHSVLFAPNGAILHKQHVPAFCPASEATVRPVTPRGVPLHFIWPTTTIPSLSPSPRRPPPSPLSAVRRTSHYVPRVWATTKFLPAKLCPSWIPQPIPPEYPAALDGRDCDKERDEEARYSRPRHL